MYQQIGNEFTEGTSSNFQNISSLALNKNDERDIFIDSLLTNLLSDEKQREKDSLAAKIKYKRHQLELNIKQIKKEEKSKKDSSLGKQAKKIKNKKRLILNCKVKKALRMYKLDKNEILDFNKYEKMNESWNSYAISCLLTCLPKNVNNSSQIENELLSEENVLNCLKQIDYHGCYLTVVRSNSKYQIGICGIVLQDKKNVFYILTKENKIKIIPKYGNLFEFELLGTKFTLVGSNMCYRPEMRTTKHAKIKTKNNIK